jgi:hypothetical protein
MMTMGQCSCNVKANFINITADLGLQCAGQQGDKELAKQLQVAEI